LVLTCVQDSGAISEHVVAISEHVGAISEPLVVITLRMGAGSCPLRHDAGVQAEGLECATLVHAKQVITLPVFPQAFCANILGAVRIALDSAVAAERSYLMPRSL